MNGEVYAVSGTETAGDVLRRFVELDISSAPVVDSSGALSAVVSFRDLVLVEPTSLAHTVASLQPFALHPDTTCSDAAAELVERGLHHAPVVDAKGALVGVVSLLDLTRALLGVPIRHPRAFPNWDAELNVAWTSDARFDIGEVSGLPRAPGIFALLRGGAGNEEHIVWTEACSDLRNRLITLLRNPGAANGPLGRVLQESGLRFRAAVVEDDERRGATVLTLRERISSLP